MPGARVAYVDKDPEACDYLRYVMPGGASEGIAVVCEDLRHPAGVWREAVKARVVRPEQPVCILATLVLHFLAPGRCAGAGRQYVRRAAPGSLVAVSVPHTGDEVAWKRLAEAYPRVPAWNFSEADVRAALSGPGTRAAGGVRGGRPAARVGGRPGLPEGAELHARRDRPEGLADRPRGCARPGPRHGQHLTAGLERARPRGAVDRIDADPDRESLLPRFQDSLRGDGGEVLAAGDRPGDGLVLRVADRDRGRSRRHPRLTGLSGTVSSGAAGEDGSDDGDGLGTGTGDRTVRRDLRDDAPGLPHGRLRPGQGGGRCHRGGGVDAGGGSGRGAGVVRHGAGRLHLDGGRRVPTVAAARAAGARTR